MRPVIRPVTLAAAATLVLASPSRAGDDAVDPIELTRIAVGDLTFQARVGGPKDGELVVLLHGFPQTSYAFREQLELLALDGYRVLAPDQRGYSPGARPASVDEYGLGDLADDVIDIADAVGAERFHLVGHDWGGAVAWAVAAGHSDRLLSLTVLSTPHPRALGAARSSPTGDQAQRSSYFGDFAADDAEQRFLADDARFLRSILGSPAIAPEDVDVYVKALGTEEALRGALNWYRALVAAAGRPAPGLGSPITVPTLYLWGAEDGAFGREAAEATASFVAGPYAFHALEGVGHWLLEGAGETVDRLLLAHLAASRPASTSGARVTTLLTDRPLRSRGRLGGVSLAPNGDLYVSNFSATLWRVKPDGATTIVDQTARGASGNAVGPDGSVFQASISDNRVIRISPEGEAEIWAEGGGMTSPVGLAVGADGSVFVCNCRGNSISRITPDRAVEPFAQSGDFECPNGIAFDRDGSLIVVSFENGHVVRVRPDGSAERWVTLPEGGNAHVAVTDDAVWITKAAANRLYRLERDGSFAPFAGTGETGLEDGPALEATLAVPNGIAASRDGRTLFINNLKGPWRGEVETEIVIRRIELTSSAASGPEAQLARASPADR